ncbi:MAG TPA: tripartite tricarboxylate transporter substrate binding protein [Burkholderiales bacterium]|nr:tripartite tricarboxylate transporter substrate binding protein [Burkholderiales bacterium]
MTFIYRLAVAVAASLAGVSTHAAAPAAGYADYPRKPIRIIVGFTPGGGPDITARYVAQKLTERWKQQVIVDNRPGAGGIIAAQLAANANPDGYTLLSVSSAHAVTPAIYSKLPYDTLRDFSGITGTATSKYLLIVSPGQPYRSIKDLIAAAKARPGQLNFSSAGVGSGSHFTGELFKSMAKIDVVHVPFKGIPEALTEAMSGRAHYFMSPIANAVNLAKEGRVIALGVSSPRRDPLLPDVPTIAEAGVPRFESELWFGLLTTSKTPRALVTRLNDEITAILKEPEARSRWAPLGLEPIPSTPERFDQRIASEVKLYTELARAGNIRAD